MEEGILYAAQELELLRFFLSNIEFGNHPGNLVVRVSAQGAGSQGLIPTPSRLRCQTGRVCMSSLALGIHEFLGN